MALTASQRRYLRGLAHPLKPVILLGAKGVTEAVIAELDQALSHHELLKVKLAAEGRQARQAQAHSLAAAVAAEPVQQVGRMLCLYRRNQDEPKLALPR